MLQPTQDRILVKPSNPETVTKSGFIIPDSAQEKPSKGTVVRVGKGRLTDAGTYIPLEVREQDEVLYTKHAGQTIKIDGEEYIVLKEDDILGVVEKE